MNLNKWFLFHTFSLHTNASDTIHQLKDVDVLYLHNFRLTQTLIFHINTVAQNSFIVSMKHMLLK